MEEALKFIADVHLGKLARMLRMLGIDTAYKNNYTKEQLVIIAQNEDRILLSRNAALATLSSIECFIVTHEQPEIQLEEVLKRYQLRNYLQPFTRCLSCNGTLRAVQKENIAHLLQPETVGYFHTFWQCSDCDHVYWKGSHYERMLKRIERMEKNRGV